MTSSPVNGELWRRQLEAIGDLTAFLHEHAPGTDTFLPVVPWRVGTDGSVFTDLTALEPDPAVLALFSEALDTGGIEQAEAGDRTLYRVTWRIGPTDEASGRPRTRCTLAVSVGPRPGGDGL